MNFLKATVTGLSDTGATFALVSQPQVRLSVPVKASVKPGDVVNVGIRPENFVAAGTGDADLTVEVDVAEHLGNTSYVYAHVAADERIIIERQDSRNTIGKDSLTVGLSASRLYLFDSRGQRLR